MPLHIQEKIHPQALVEEVRSQARKEKPEDQLNLFGDFNGIRFEELIEFYRHDANWSNRMILGDSQQHQESTLRSAEDRQDRRQSDQPLWRRGDEGLRVRIVREHRRPGVTRARRLAKRRTLP